MFKKSHIMISAALLFTMATGCSSNTAEETHNPETQEPVLEEGVAENMNSTNSIQRISEMIDFIGTDEKENTILSGTSLDMAMGMLYQGATNNAEEDLNTYYDASAQEKANNDANLINEYDNFEDAEILLSNAVYANKDVPINSEFSETVYNNYNADVQNLDFSNPSSADTINNFCATKTNDMIKEIITPDTLMDKSTIILNALYFNAEWEEKFLQENIQDTDFHNADGSISNVKGMNEFKEQLYYETENAKGFAKYYKGSQFAFIGILPNESIIDENNDFKVVDIDINTLLKSGSFQKTKIMIPKFKIKDTNCLNESLANQGLENIFEGANNFEKISPVSMVVANVIQKVVVDVDENGTEAAAVTKIEMYKSARPNKVEPKSVILDRPFVFMVYDINNEEVLFMGKITKL